MHGLLANSGHYCVGDLAEVNSFVCAARYAQQCLLILDASVQHLDHRDYVCSLRTC